MKRGMDSDILIGLAFITSIVLVGSFLLFVRCVKRPTALDVYHGKTTLEITYRDSVAIDSTVVYKVR